MNEPMGTAEFIPAQYTTEELKQYISATILKLQQERTAPTAQPWMWPVWEKNVVMAQREINQRERR
jgi:hypothetical protein